MKINLIDDTALIETNFTRNASGQKRTVLGLHQNLQTQEPSGDSSLTASIGNAKFKRNMGVSENRKVQESGSKMGLVRTSWNVKRNLGFVESLKMNQDSASIGNGCGKEKLNVGFGENVKKHKSFNQTSLIRNDGVKKSCGEERELVGFCEKVKNQEIGKGIGINETDSGVGIKKNQENGKGIGIFENDSGVGIKKNQENVKEFRGFGANQERNGKIIRKWKPIGKVEKKCDETAPEDDKVLTIGVVEFQENGGGNKSDATKICYSRKEMEALRFVNEEDQKKKWSEICGEFGPVVKKEYDGLLDHQQQVQQPGFNIYPQSDFQKRVTACGILGPMAANGKGKIFERKISA